MKPQTTVSSRTSIAITNSTISKMKALAKGSGVKMYELVEGLVSLASEDESVLNRSVEIAKEIAAKKKGEKFLLSKLPPNIKKKLEAMSPEQLAALLEKSNG